MASPPLFQSIFGAELNVSCLVQRARVFRVHQSNIASGLFTALSRPKNTVVVLTQDLIEGYQLGSVFLFEFSHLRRGVSVIDIGCFAKGHKGFLSKLKNLTAPRYKQNVLKSKVGTLFSVSRNHVLIIKLRISKEPFRVRWLRLIGRSVDSFFPFGALCQDQSDWGAVLQVAMGHAALRHDENILLRPRQPFRH